MGNAGEVEKRFAAGLALFGLVDLPLIHYSVQRWRGVHPTVITGKGGGLESEMYWALGLSFIAFTGLRRPLDLGAGLCGTTTRRNREATIRVDAPMKELTCEL